MTEEPGIDYWRFSYLRRVQSGYGSCPASYLMGTGESGQAVKLTTHLLLGSKIRTVELYLHTPTRLHGIVLN
jgi:hypothetical protein